MLSRSVTWDFPLTSWPCDELKAVLNSSGKAGNIINAATTVVVETSAGRSKTTLVVESKDALQWLA